MRYTIKEVMPAQIKVQFEDKSVAIVPIGPDYTPEDIDDAVSYYDKDFQLDPEILINKNISLEEKRVSTRKPVVLSNYAPDIPDFELPVISNEMYGGLPTPKFTKDQIIISYVMADYFIKNNNDDRLKVALDKKVEEYIVENNITSEMALESLMFEDNDLIVNLAQQELDNERQ